jgi:hypothetical protein
MIEFSEFQKISRLNREVIVTEKIDGTNGQVHIRVKDGDPEFGYDTQVDIGGVPHLLRAGSRNRWVTQMGDDNFGFGRWVYQNAHELAQLGPGAHFGEWWGMGIQRKYGLAEKRWSLFNTSRWTETRPDCCCVVPILSTGVGFGAVDEALHLLREHGSVAAHGFPKPEGVVVFHVHSRSLFKVTLERDEEPKSAHR